MATLLNKNACIRKNIQCYMEIKRDLYLNKLIRSMHNGMIKVVTGIRRCGNNEEFLYVVGQNNGLTALEKL